MSKYRQTMRDALALVTEAVSSAQQAAIAISKKEKEKEKTEDDFKPHMMYDPKTGKGYEAKTMDDHLRMKDMGYTHEKPEQSEALDEAKFSSDMIDKLRKAYEPLKGKKIPPNPLMKIFDKIDSNKDGLIQLYKADIPFVSMMAMSRLMLKHNMKADDINKLGKIRREDFVDVLDEAPKYDLYHKDFSGAMQHSYKMAKKLYGITIDPKEIDDKVATGPKKPSSGKTNTYRLKGDKGNIQVQVANLDNKKYELNMYKEEVDLDEAKMSEILKYNKDGMSTKDIAKKCGMSESEVKALLSQPKTVQKAIMSLEEPEHHNCGTDDCCGECEDTIIPVDAFNNKNAKHDADLNEAIKMGDPKLIKLFDKLKKKDEVQFKIDSSMSKGTEFQTYIVKSKNTVNKGRVEKITLVTKGNEKAVKKFLYKRDDKVTFAIGDMAASIADMKENNYTGEIVTDFEVQLVSERPSARADAMRAMGTRRGVDPADKDDDADANDKELAKLNMIMQLRKAKDVKGNHELIFQDKKKKKFDMKIIDALLRKHDSFRRPNEKLAFANKIAKSARDMLNALKEETKVESTLFSKIHEKILKGRK